MDLLNAVKMTRVSSAVAVGTASVTGTTVDMQDFDGAVFVAAFGAITDGTPAIKVQGGNASDGSDMADLAGTSTAAAITDDNKLLAVEVYRPSCRYLRVVAVRGGTTGAVLDSMTCLQYEPKKKPTVQDATTVSASNIVVSPTAGAA